MASLEVPRGSRSHHIRSHSSIGGIYLHRSGDVACEFGGCGARGKGIPLVSVSCVKGQMRCEDHLGGGHSLKCLGPCFVEKRCVGLSDLKGGTSSWGQAGLLWG